MTNEREHDSSLGERLSAARAVAKGLDWSNEEIAGAVLRSLPESFELTGARPYRPHRASTEARVSALVDWLEISPGDRVLDVACGIGLFAFAMGFRGALVTGCDPSPAAVRTARRNCAGVPTSLQSADIRDLDVPQATFDSVVYLHGQVALRDSQDRHRALQALRRALIPGGRLAVEIPAIPTGRVNDSSWGTASTEGTDAAPVVLAERHRDNGAQATTGRVYVVVGSGEVTSWEEIVRDLGVEQLESEVASAGFRVDAIHEDWAGRLGDVGTGWHVLLASRPMDTP
jgi:SAM-dependent methyltransferase